MLKSLLLATIITTSFTNIEANHINRLARLSHPLNNINRRTLTWDDQQQQQQNPQQPQKPVTPVYTTAKPTTPVKVYTPRPTTTTTTAKPTTTTAKPTTTTTKPTTTTAKPTTTTAKPTTTTAKPTTYKPTPCPTTTTAKPTTTTAKPTTTTAKPTTTTAKPTPPRKYTPRPTTTTAKPTTTTAKPTTTTPLPLTIPPCKCDKMVGSQCYCKKVVVTPNIVYSSSKSKGSKGSKGKGSKGAKGSKSGSTNSLPLGIGGIGDCDCEGGQITLALMYQGSGMVNIEWYIAAKGGKSADYSTINNNYGTLICVNSFVKTGDEILCDTQNPSAPNAMAVEKLGTETIVVIKDIESNNNKCVTSIHTSCSQDIVGYSYCEDSNSGVMDIIVTGWKDKLNLIDGGECGNSYEKCNCMV